MVKSSKSVKKFTKKHLDAAIKRRHKLKPMKNAIRRKLSASHPEGSKAHKKRVQGEVANQSPTLPSLDNDEANQIGMQYPMKPGQGMKVESSNLNLSSDDDPEPSEDEDDEIFSDDDQEQIRTDRRTLSKRPRSDVENDVSDSGEETEANGSGLHTQNKRLRSEVELHKKQLQQLQQKDPEFYKFLKEHDQELLKFSDEENEEDEEGEDGRREHPSVLKTDENNENLSTSLTTSVVEAWCTAVKEKNHMGSLRNLLQAFRSACHYGDGEGEDLSSKYNISSSHVFNKIMVFALSEMDSVFKNILGLRDMEENRKEKAFEMVQLQKIGRWKKMAAFVKTYLANTLHILNQMTDNNMIAFTLRRLKPSVMFLVAFPKLTRKYLKVALHFWGSGDGALPVISLMFIREMAIRLGPPSLEACLKGIYREYAANSKFVTVASLPRILFMASCVVEIYGIDLSKSYHHAFIFIRQMAIILRNALQVKTKDAFKNVYSWQYINSLKLWVKVLCTYTTEDELRPLSYPLAQIIGGVARLVPTAQYFPLRLQCAKLLNELASATGSFIPVSSLLLDMLQFKELHTSPTGGVGKALDFDATLKVPKAVLKTRAFQEECVTSVQGQLAEHLAQWSHAIGFPELAVVPVVQLRQFLKTTKVDRFRRQIKQLVDQVEKNVQYVEAKRKLVAFSPKDASSVATFLQAEKQAGASPLSHLIITLRQQAIQRQSYIHKSSAVVGGQEFSEFDNNAKLRARDEVDADGDEEEGSKVFNKIWLPTKKTESMKKKEKSAEKEARTSSMNEEDNDVLEDLLLSSDEDLSADSDGEKSRQLEKKGFAPSNNRSGKFSKLGQNGFVHSGKKGKTRGPGVKQKPNVKAGDGKKRKQFGGKFKKPQGK